MHAAGRDRGNHLPVTNAPPRPPPAFPRQCGKDLQTAHQDPTRNHDVGGTLRVHHSRPYFRESIMTMTVYIVQVSLGAAPAGSIAFKTLFAVAALLFVITLT
jgi:hypothetical protein